MKVEIVLNLKQGAQPRETVDYLLKLETFVKRRFANVTNFHCEKPLRENYVLLSFEHDGYTIEHKDPEMMLFYSELKFLHG